MTIKSGVSFYFAYCLLTNRQSPSKVINREHIQQQQQEEKDLRGGSKVRQRKEEKRPRIFLFFFFFVSMPRHTGSTQIEINTLGQQFATVNPYNIYNNIVPHLSFFFFSIASTVKYRSIPTQSQSIFFFYFLFYYYGQSIQRRYYKSETSPTDSSHRERITFPYFSFSVGRLVSFDMIILSIEIIIGMCIVLCVFLRVNYLLRPDECVC